MTSGSDQQMSRLHAGIAGPKLYSQCSPHLPNSSSTILLLVRLLLLPPDFSKYRYHRDDDYNDAYHVHFFLYSAATKTGVTKLILNICTDLGCFEARPVLALAFVDCFLDTRRALTVQGSPNRSRVRPITSRRIRLPPACPLAQA